MAIDLDPCGRFIPCGYPGLKVTELRALAGGVETAAVARALIGEIAKVVGLTPSADDLTLCAADRV